MVKKIFPPKREGGGYPFLTRFPRRGMDILQRCRRGVSILYTKKKTQQKAPAALDASEVSTLAPAALKTFRHLEGGTCFWTETPRRGATKFYGNSGGGGVSIFTDNSWSTQVNSSQTKST